MTKIKKLRYAIPIVLVPALAWAGTVLLKGQRHLIISLAVAVLALLLFAAGYEKRNIGTRRMVVAAIMTALAVTGRFIPLVKPVTAITMLSGIYLGGETGFLVGALSALISDIYFGQGPWTAFQMLAWGLSGLISGLLSRHLKANRFILITAGAVFGVIFSMIMDIWSVLWYAGEFNAGLYLAAIVSAAPFTLLYAGSNAVWLWLLGKPIGEKLERVQIKYGL